MLGNFTTKYLTYILALACTCLSARTLAASGVPEPLAAHRPCMQDDLPGLWTVVRWTTYIDPSQLNSYAAPHQWFWISLDGSIRSVVSNRPNDQVGAIRETLEAMPEVVHFTSPANGVIETTRSDQPGAAERWLAYTITANLPAGENNPEQLAGDVVMTLIDQSGKPIYTRQMRKLQGYTPPGMLPR
jgi:hypothetical protein